MGDIPIIGPAIDWITDGIGSVGDGVVNAVFGFIGGIFDGLIGAVSGLVDLLPDAADLGIPDLSGWVRGYDYLNAFLPISEALIGLGLYLAAANAGFIWNLAIRVYHLIPKPGMGT